MNNQEQVWLQNMLDLAQHNIGLLIISVAGILLMLLALSYRLSLRIYSKRDF